MLTAFFYFHLENELFLFRNEEMNDVIAAKERVVTRQRSRYVYTQCRIHFIVISGIAVKFN